MTADQATLQFEIFKLLLQAAWADMEIQDSERKMLLDYARNFAYTPEDLENIEGYLSGAAPLPPPNMSLLKEHKEDVIKITESLLKSDNVFDADEAEILAEIETLLT